MSLLLWYVFYPAAHLRLESPRFQGLMAHPATLLDSAGPGLEEQPLAVQCCSPHTLVDATEDLRTKPQALLPVYLTS